MKTNKLIYTPLNSSIHKSNSTLKLLYLIFYIIIGLLPHNLDLIVLASFIIVAYLMIASKIPLRNYIQVVCKTYVIIIALFIILASLNYTLMDSTLIVLKFVFGVSLYSMIIYTTNPFDLAMGIYGIVKHLNLLALFLLLHL